MKTKNNYSLLGLIVTFNILFIIQLNGQIDYSDWNPNFPITYNTSGECVKGKPGIAFDGTNFLCVWQNGSNIYGTRISPSGTILDPDGISISVGLNNSTYFPSVAFDGENFLIVWIAQREISTEIYGSRVSKNGVVIDPGGIKLTTGADPLLRMPGIAFDNENYFIVWRTNSNNIFGTRISPSLTNLDEPNGFVISNTNTSYYPAVASNGTNFMVSWHDSRNSSNGWDIYASRVTKDGVVLDANGFIVCDEPQNQEHTTIAFNGLNYVIVWYDWRPDNNKTIGSLYTARVSINGTVLDSPALFISDHVRGEWAPQIASSGEESMIVWNMELSQGANARLWDIYGTRLSKDGEILDRGINISTSFWHQAQPIIGYGDSTYLITWNDMRNYGGVNGMYGQLIGKDQTGFSPPYKDRALLSENWIKETYNFGYSGACDGIAFSDSDAYIFADHAIVHYAGNNWELEKSVETPYGSWAYDSDFIFAGGWAGIYYIYNGNNWLVHDIPNSFISGVYGFDKKNIWATTHKGGLYKFIDENNYSNYEMVLSNVPLDFEDIWGIDSNNIYIVGEKGIIIHYDGTEWSRLNDIPIKQTLNSIWGSTEDNIFVVGDWGTILHFNGSNWSLQESPTKENLFDIWGVNGTNIYAVGNNGTIIHYNGNIWESIDGKTNQDLLTVFGYYNQSENKYAIWIAGAGDTILKYNAILSNIDTAICQGDSIFIGGNYQKNSGKYYDFQYSSPGENIVIITTLSIMPDYLIEQEINICSNDSIFIRGEYRHVSGIYYDTLNTNFGCDSIIAYNVQMYDTIAIMKKLYVCEGDSILINNNYIKEPGIYYDTIVSEFECDTAFTIELIMNLKNDTTIIETICQGDSIVISSSIFKETGNYSVTLSNQSGCDSIINIDLNVNPIPYVKIGYDTIICKNDTIVLSSNSDFINYLWSTNEITKNIEIIGSKIGVGVFEYWLEVMNENNCINSDTIIITINETTKINGIISSGYIKCYPNPTNDFLNIEIMGVNKKIKIEIIAENGRIILTKNYKEVVNIKDKFDLKEFNAGWYVIKIQTDSEIKMNKFLLIK
ncbi:MAG: hypothetical protein A2W99_05355 [Bacteroidetes bacterium GWF2_33_16]|nr:MAG: hypothetical protein A2X00_17875 [Bacteroidetes bacterium GWE2_32_14]OFY06089.1 MAG: hypothetical protein A2W99_05355 [Bacteroidetes bacterium GWF2_33_16]